MAPPPRYPLACRAALGVYGVVGWAVCKVLSSRRWWVAADCHEARRSAERLGEWGPASARPVPSVHRAQVPPTVWIQAASVGEVGVAGRLVAALRQRCSELHVVLSTNTPTGYAAASAHGFDEIHYFPVDYAPIVRKVLRLIDASILVLVETELWPAALREMDRAGVPVVAVNARISARSWPRYQRIAGLIGPLVATLRSVLARDEASAARFRDLGVPTARVVVTGDVKFDSLDDEAVAAVSSPLPGLASDRRLVLAASTHEGEEVTCLDAYTGLRRGRPDSTILVLAPRHPDRAGDVVALARARGFRVQRLTALASSETSSTSVSHGRESLGAVPPPDAEDGELSGLDVIVVDRMGQLLSFFSVASAVFMGGSLSSTGGHNLLEPAAFSRPMAAGPHLENVAEQAAELQRLGALVTVHGAEDLAAVWRSWLDDPTKAARLGLAAKGFVAGNRGSVHRSADALASLLLRGRAFEPDRSAPADDDARGRP